MKHLASLSLTSYKTEQGSSLPDRCSVVSEMSAVTSRVGKKTALTAMNQPSYREHAQDRGCRPTYKALP